MNNLTAPVRPLEDPFKPRKSINNGKLPNQTIRQGPSNVKSVSYLADYAGCGHYRVIWPNMVINSTYTVPNKVGNRPRISVIDSDVAIFEPNLFYNDIKTVRVQRQATDSQLNFLKHFLHGVRGKKNFKIAYDADDWFFDIPKFNHASKSYNKDILTNIASIMVNMDYITVTTSFLRKKFIEILKIPPERVIVIPNMLPRFLFDGYYDKDKIKQKAKNIPSKPRILWTGSPTHFDINGGTDDDIKVLREYVNKTSKRFQWVFLGVKEEMLSIMGMPSNVECHPWINILNYPQKIVDLDIDLAVIPLQHCDFNYSKSNIKLLELGALGVPCVFQDIEPYQFAPYKFDGYDDLDQKVQRILKDKKLYSTVCASQRNFVDKNFWLEDNSGYWCDLYEDNNEILLKRTLDKFAKLV